MSGLGKPMSPADHYVRALDLEQLAVRQYESSDLAEPNPLWTLTIQQARLHAELASACTLATALEPLARANIAGRN